MGGVRSSPAARREELICQLGVSLAVSKSCYQLGWFRRADISWAVSKNCYQLGFFEELLSVGLFRRAVISWAGFEEPCISSAVRHEEPVYTGK